MIKRMAKVFSSGETEPDLKDTSKRIRLMGRERCNIVMDVATLVITRTV